MDLSSGVVVDLSIVRGKAAMVETGWFFVVFKMCHMNFNVNAE